MLRIAATIGLKTYYFASEDVDYDNTFWEARISNQFEIERFFDISESTGNRIRSMQITLDNRDNFFKDIEANASLLNSKFVLYFNDGDDKVKTFTGKVNKIDSFGDDVSLTLMERGYEYLKNNFPDAQIAYDYYSESGINDSWNAIPIPFGSVNKIPLAWVNLFRSEFIIGSGPIFNVNKLYFDKVVVYDRIEEKNGYQPTPESQEIKFRIFKGTGSIGSPEVVDGVTSEYPGFAYVQLYKIVDGVEEPADPLTPDGDVSQIYADIEGIVNDTGTAPERNPIKILYMLFTKPYTGYEGYGLEIDPDDLDFDDAILEANIQGFKIDGAIDRIAEFGEWVDELLRCARASLTEEDGKIKVYVDSAKTYSGVHFDASGDNGYECDISPWTEPEVDAQINRLRLSYSWNFERNDFNKKPGVHEESFLLDPNLKDEAHAERIGKWNTDTIEFKLIKDDTTAHKLAQYYLKSKVKQLKTTSLVTEVRIPNIDAGDLVKVSYEKFGWVEKEFVVTKIKRNEDSTELDIKEYSSDVYTFVSPGEEPELPDNPRSQYNIPTKPIMNDIQVVNTILQDGSNQTLIKVDFTHTSDNAHMIALYFKEDSEPESAFSQLDTAVNKNVITTIWRGRVTGNYNFRIATISTMGLISPITIEDGDRHYYGQPTEEVPVSVHVDGEAPGTPSISIVKPFVGGVSIYITIPDGMPDDFAYFNIFRKLDGKEPALLATYHTSAIFNDNERETAEHSRVYYAVAVDRNGNASAMSAASAESTPLKVSDADLSADAIKVPTGSILSLSAKNCTAASIAEVNGVKDVSGNGNHGQAFGGVEVVDSEMGKAFQFDGVDDYIIDNSVTYENATEFTVSIWAKKTGYTGTQSLYSDYYSELQRSVILGQEITETEMRWYCGDGINVKSVIVDNVFILDEWAYWTGVFKGSEYMRLYKNGVLIGELIDDVPEKIAVSHYNRYFGRKESHYFTGLIAHPKIFKRALSPSEIKTLYMFPDDVVFGQLTADLIGANIIKAQNLIQSEAVITSSAQIDNAIITNAHIQNLDAGKITTGEMKSNNYVPPSIGENFATSGSSFDLDNASITTENFYSNADGAGFKGDVQADTGRVGGFSITGGLLSSFPTLKIKFAVTTSADRFKILFNYVKTEILGNDSEFGNSSMEPIDFADYSEFVAEEERCFDKSLEVIYDVENTAPEDLPEFSATSETSLSGFRFYVEYEYSVEINDIFMVRSGSDLEFWGKVIDVGEDDFGYYLDFIIINGSLFEVTKGQAVINYGNDGAGGIVLDGEAPRIDFFVNNGIPWLGLVPFMRLGNLNGIGGITEDIHGLYIGSYSGNNLKYDTTSGTLAFSGDITGSSGRFSGELVSNNFAINPLGGYARLASTWGSETNPAYIYLGNIYTQLSVYPPFLIYLKIAIKSSVVEFLGTGNYGRPGGISAQTLHRFLISQPMDDNSGLTNSSFSFLVYSDGRLFLKIDSVVWDYLEGIRVIESSFPDLSISTSAPSGVISQTHQTLNADANISRIYTQKYSTTDWTRRYNDGFLEQGGTIVNATAGSAEVEFAGQDYYSDANYTLLLSVHRDSTTAYPENSVALITEKRLTGFTILRRWSSPTQHGYSNCSVDWVAKGFK